MAIHSPLLDSPKFWKLGRHNSAGVRQAFYVVVSKLCQVLPDAVVTRGASAVPAILGGGLQDADVPAAAWGAALHLLAVFPGAWAHISPQKAVFPTIWKLLKAGGIGESQAAQIYPNLMPFLSKIPPEVMGDSGKFLQRWFSSMFEGLQVDVRAVTDDSRVGQVTGDLLSTKPMFIQFQTPRFFINTRLSSTGCRLAPHSRL